jgi:hypothetical protein
VTHGFPHQFDQLLNLGTDDFGGTQGSPCLPEHRFTDLNYVKTHAQIVPENQLNKIFRRPLLFARGGSTLVET